MDLDLQLISAILRDKDSFFKVKKSGILSENLFGVGVSGFDFINNHVKEFGEIPSCDFFSAKTTIVPVDVSESIEVIISDVKERTLWNKLKSVHEKCSGYLTSQQPKKALEEFQKAIRDSYKDGITGSKIENLLGLGEDVVKLYDKMKSGERGILSPWPAMDEQTLGWWGGDFVVFVARMGTGKCVSWDTEIPSPVDGIYRKIVDVVNDKSPVWTRASYDKIYRVKPDLHIHTGRKKCLEVRTHSGLSIVVTPEHPFSIIGGWKRADGLLAGDCVEAVSFIPEPEVTDDSIAEEHIFLISGLIAEGGLTIDPPKFSNVDPAIVKIIRKSTASIGCKFVKHKGMNESTWSLSRKEISGCNLVRELLKKWGIGYEKSTGKRIPDRVFSLSNRLLAKFIGFLWSCDGSVEKRNVLSYSSSSEIIVIQLKRLLLRFGITGRIRPKTTSCNGKRFKSWEFAVHSTCIGKFIDSIPLFGEKSKKLKSMFRGTNPNVDNVPVTEWLVKKINSVIDEGKSKGILISDFGKSIGWSTHFSRRVFFQYGGISKRMLLNFANFYGCDELKSVCCPHWDKIVSVCDAGEREVYDLTVSDSHCFVANDLVVHNTFAMLMLARKAWMDGKRVLFVGTEMSKLKLALRFYAIHLRLPYKEFRRGQLDTTMEVRFKESMVEASKGEGLEIVGDDFDCAIAQIEAAVEQARPDILFVDGIYLVKNVGKDRHSRVSNTADDLKRLARRMDIPVIASTQFNRDVAANAKSTVSAANVGITDVIGWNCLCSDSLIFLKDKIVKFSDIDGSVHLFDYRGDSIGRIVDSGVKEAWEIELENGLKLKCSKDHRVFVLRDNFEVEDIKVCDLSTDDIMPIIKKFNGGSDKLDGFVSSRKDNGLVFPNVWSESLSEIIGYCIGDAWLAHDNEWQIAVAYNELDVGDLIISNVAKLFNGYLCKIRDEKTCRAIHLNNVRIIEFMRWLGVDSGWKSDTKGVPDKVWQSTIFIRRAFLRGLYSADGCVNKTGNVVLSTVSERLSQDVLKLLFTVGISATVRTASINQTRDGGYKIWIDLFNSKKFIDEIGFLSDRKKRMAIERCNPTDRKRCRVPENFSYVRSVRNTGIKVPMKDVVGATYGRFVANCIPVHNCDCMFGMYQNDDMREDKTMGFKALKLREGENADFFTNWDFEDMNFDQIDTGGNSGISDDFFDKIPGQSISTDAGSSEEDLF